MSELIKQSATAITPAIKLSNEKQTANTTALFVFEDDFEIGKELYKKGGIFDGTGYFFPKAKEEQAIEYADENNLVSFHQPLPEDFDSFINKKQLGVLKPKLKSNRTRYETV